MGVRGLRLSLAGAQDKAAVCKLGDDLALPAKGCPTTHILKPLAVGFDGLVHNEYLCLQLAKAVGLRVPHAEIRWAQDIPYLLIERYDRQLTQQGRQIKVKRIHQEDFCQALGVVSLYKYQQEGGPSWQDAFALLRRTTQPAKDRNTLAAMMAFNVLIGNMDAHGKNYSLLHHGPNWVEMAPVYDVICTRVYKDLSNKMAMKIGGYYDPSKLLGRHWERECKAIGYAYPALRQVLYQQGQALLEAITIERGKMQAEDLDHPITAKIAKTLETQIPKMLSRLEVG